MIFHDLDYQLLIWFSLFALSGCSVRDLLDHRMGGLDIASAIKVLRDSARGMDFLHK